MYVLAAGVGDSYLVGSSVDSTVARILRRRPPSLTDERPVVVWLKFDPYWEFEEEPYEVPSDWLVGVDVPA